MDIPMIIENIKSAQITARRAKYQVASSLLTTIIGEAEMLGKNAGNRAPTDAEVIQILKKFEKNMLENLKIFNDRNLEDKAKEMLVEMSIVQQFLPAKLTDLQVEKDIATVMQTLSLTKEQKSMGALTKELKAKYGDQFDGAQVSKIFKAMLV